MSAADRQPSTSEWVVPGNGEEAPTAPQEAAPPPGEATAAGADPMFSLAALERRLDEMLEVARRGSVESAEQAVRAAELAARAGAQAADAEQFSRGALARSEAALDSAARADLRAQELFDRWVLLDARVTGLAERFESEHRTTVKRSEELAVETEDRMRRFNERADRVSAFLAELENRPPAHVSVAANGG